jgi:hypothetical protein
MNNGERDTEARQPQRPSFRCRSTEERVRRPEQQGVVADEQVHGSTLQTRDDVVGHLVTQRDSLYARRGIAKLEANGIPSCRFLQRRTLAK